MTQTLRKNLPQRIIRFYADGFRSMTVGRWLWAMILAKLAVFFLVLKLFFFPDILEERYDNDTDRSNAVRSAMTTKSQSADFIPR